MDSRAMIEALRKKVLGDVVSDQLYIPSQGKRTTLADVEPFDLFEAMKKFMVFESGDKKDAKEPGESRKVLLLLGNGGSGKSLFCNDLIIKLWKDYKPGNPIPLLIPLALLENPF